MGELVTPARRQLEHVAIRLTGQVSRQIEKLLRDEMHDIPFPPDLAVDCHHRRSQHYAPALLEAASTTTFARPPSSSMVKNMTPFANPASGGQGPARPSSAISHRGLSWRARDYSAPRSVRLSPSAFGPHSSISHTFLGSNSNGSKGAGRLQTV
jgi:hypothetical protein